MVNQNEPGFELARLLGKEVLRSAARRTRRCNKNKTKLRDQRSCRCCHVAVVAWRLAWASDACILKAFAIHESLPQRSRLIDVERLLWTQ